VSTQRERGDLRQAFSGTVEAPAGVPAGAWLPYVSSWLSASIEPVLPGGVRAQVGNEQAEVEVFLLYVVKAAKRRLLLPAAVPCGTRRRHGERRECALRLTGADPVVSTEGPGLWVASRNRQVLGAPGARDFLLDVSDSTEDWALCSRLTTRGVLASLGHLAVTGPRPGTARACTARARRYPCRGRPPGRGLGPAQLVELVGGAGTTDGKLR
jgi:hypothetical protein